MHTRAVRYSEARNPASFREFRPGAWSAPTAWWVCRTGREQPVRAGPREAHMKGGNILIVDDSPVSRKILRSCLPKERELAIAEAGDGSAGLQQFRDRRPDLTFLDLTMPKMPGLDCLAQIKALAPKAVVVVVTADVQPTAVARALELGAAEVLRKPPTREAVAEVLGRVEPLLRGPDAT